RGVFLSEGKATVGDVEILHRTREQSALSIKLTETHNRQVRRMLAALGHPVRNLKCTRIGPIELKNLPLGAARELSRYEIAELRRTIQNAVPIDVHRARSRRTARKPVDSNVRGSTPPPRAANARRPSAAGREGTAQRRE